MSCYSGATTSIHSWCPVHGFHLYTPLYYAYVLSRWTVAFYNVKG